MNTYSYELVDGTKGIVQADRYEKTEKGYVFLKDGKQVYFIPTTWIWDLKRVEIVQ